MGSLNSISPAHVDNGIAYRQLSYEHRRRLALIKPYVKTGDRRAIICHDVLLAKIAAIESVFLSMSGNGLLPADKNSTAKDYCKLAINSKLFMAQFDQEVTNEKW